MEASFRALEAGYRLLRGAFRHEPKGRRGGALAALVAVSLLLTLLWAPPALADTPPVNTALPTIDGTADVGQTLHANPGTWTGSPAPTFAYQWQDCTAADYRSAVLADAPVGYWRLGDAIPSTVAYEESAAHWSGTYTNGPTLGAPGLLTDDPNPAATFDGTNDIVTTSLTNTTAQLGQYSLEAWIKRSGTSTADQVIVGGNASISLRIRANTTGASITFWTGSTSVFATSAASVTDGARHHLVGTWDGTTLRIYVDGVLSGSNAPGGAPPGSTTGISIGNHPGQALAFGGTIDEVAFYRTTLSATRIAAHWASGVVSCTNIAGATAQDYQVASSDRGYKLHVVVTGTNAAGSAQATSTRTDAILGAPTNESPPTVSGTYAQGQTLTGTDGQWSGSPPISLAYSWFRCGYYHEVTGLSPAPTSYWRLSDLPGTTTAVDSSGHGHNGVYQHYPTLGVPGALNGDPNTAVSFDGSSNYMSDSSSSYPTGSAAATISFWFISPRMPASNGATTVLAGYSGFQVKLGPLGKLQINSSISPTVLSANTWYHVVAVDPGGGGALKLYVNGQLDALSGNASAAKAGGEFDIGGSSTTATNATIDDVAAFPGALTAAQVQGLYNAGIQEDPPDGCTAISGATASTYQVQQADEQSKLSFQVTATNSVGSASATSSEHIVRSPGPSNLDAPSVSGTPSVGQTLSVTNGGWDGAGPITYNYQWERCGYRDAVLADQPLGYWRLGDVAQKVVTDSSGHNNTGTWTGAAAVPGALRGDGDPGFAGGNASIPSTGGLTPTGAFTIEEWVKPSSDSLPITELVKEGGDWSFQLTSNKPKLDVQNASFAHSVATSSVAITDATHWYHLVGVFTGTQSQVYVDGVLRGTGSSISGRVRTDFGGPLFWGGSGVSVDEAAFYAAGLGSTQVTTHLNAGPCTDITGATSQTYTLVSADAGKWISAIVTAQNAQGSSSASSTTTQVSGATAPLNTIRPTVSDPAEDARLLINPNDNTVQAGDVLSETDGTWVPSSGLTITRQWQRCSYAAAVLADQPNAYWPLNEPGGPKAADATGNNNDATYTGSPVFGVPGALADGANTGIRVGGGSDGLSAPDSVSLNVGQTFTLEGWVKLNGGGVVVFNKGTNGAPLGDPSLQNGYNLRVASDGSIILGQSLGNSIVTANAGALPPDGRYHYLVGTDQGGVGHLYVDNVRVDATTDTSPRISDVPHSLDMAGGNADVDELALYPTVLSTTRIAAHYTAGQAPCTDITGSTGTSYTVASGDAGQSIRVKVSATGTGGTTTAVSNGSDPVVQQGGLALDSPHDGATVRTLTPTLAMVPVAANSTTQYEFEAASDALFTSDLHNSGWLTAGNYTYTVPATWKFKDGQIWYWHARTKSSSGAVSPWTTPWSFHVQVNVLGAEDAWSMVGFGMLSVNKLNGNLLLTAPTPSYPTPSDTLSATLTYNSLGTKDTGFGKGWTFTGGPDGSEAPALTDLNSNPEPQDAAQVDWPDGHTTIYGHVAGSGDYRSPPGDGTRLFKNDDGTWTLTTPDGNVYSYGTDLAVTSYQSTSTTPGQSPLSYTYTSGKPTKIADASGRALTFTWNSLNAGACPNAILCITGPDGRTWKYIGHNTSGTTGPLERINDGVRDMLLLGYDASGRINKLQNADDLNPGGASPGYDPTHSVQVGYDGSGRVTSIDGGPITGQSPNHSIWTFSYTTSNVQTDPTRAPHAGIATGTARTAVSSTTVFKPSQYGAPSPVGTTTYYDEFNHAIEIKDPLGRISLTGYNAKGQQLWTEDAAGNPTDNTYDPVTNALTATTSPDPSGNSAFVTTRYRYDEASIGTASTSGPSTQGLAATYFKNTSRGGRGDGQRTDATIDFTWGSGGPSILGGQSDNFSARWTGYLNVAQTGDYVLSTVADGGTSLVLDGYSVISDINANGLHTKSSQSVRLKQGLHPIVLDYAETTGSSEVHLRWRCTTCATPISTQVIPAASLRPDYGNQTSSVSPAGRVSFTHYAAPWRKLGDYLQQQVGGTNLITSRRYDAYGRMIQKVLPKGNLGRTINADGNLQGSVDGRFLTNYTYYGDAEAAAPPATCGGGAVSQAGQLKATAPYGIHATTLVYDVAGRTVASTDASGTTCSSYDSEGRLIREQAPGESQATVYTYDPSGLVRTANDASGTVTLSYDEAGRIVDSIDSYGAETAFAYDRNQNLVLRRAAVGSLGGSTVYTTSYGYDESDSLVSLNDPAGRHYAFDYDSRGDLKATEYPNGTFSWNDYNAAGALIHVYNRHGTLTSPLPANAPADANAIADYAYTYDEDAKRTQETRSGGGLTTTTTHYTYDNAGRLSNVTLPDGTLRVYNYDADSNRTSIVETPPGGSAATVATYQYDPSQTPGTDELTSATTGGTTKTYQYTGDGETTHVGTNVLTWDGRGRLSGGTFGATSVSYGFDPLERNRSRTASGITTRYLFGGRESAPTFETNSASVIQASSTSGATGDLAFYAGPPTTSSSVRFAYYNGHGDTAALADTAGTRTDAYTYDPFGAVSGSPSNTKNEQWMGAYDKKLDAASALVDLGARSYDPATGRFMSVDPADGGSLNAYEATSQDPINNIDTTGTTTVPIGGGGSTGCRRFTAGDGFLWLHVYWCWAAGIITQLGQWWELTHQFANPLYGELTGFEKVGGVGRLYFYYFIHITWHPKLSQDPPLIPNFWASLYVNGYGQYRGRCGFFTGPSDPHAQAYKCGHLGW
jgi:RHS repeat-associated protein